MGVHEGGCIGGRTGRGIGVGVTYELSLSLAKPTSELYSDRRWTSQVIKIPVRSDKIIKHLHRLRAI